EPSASDLKPEPLMPVWCTKRSLPGSSGVTKPKPLSSLNHFTVPVAMCSSGECAAYAEDAVRATTYGRLHHAPTTNAGLTLIDTSSNQGSQPAYCCGLRLSRRARAALLSSRRKLLRVASER